MRQAGTWLELRPRIGSDVAIAVASSVLEEAARRRPDEHRRLQCSKSEFYESFEDVRAALAELTISDAPDYADLTRRLARALRRYV